MSLKENKHIICTYIFCNLLIISVYDHHTLKFDVLTTVSRYSAGPENNNLTFGSRMNVSEKQFIQGRYTYWPDSFNYNAYFHYRIPLKKTLDSLKLKATDTLSILIDKTDYKLSVLSGNITIKEYPVMFGKNSSDDKLRQGDGCTPEGTFKVIIKYPHTKYDKFIYFNYPNEDSRRKHNSAKAEGRIPADAKIGGEIGIHGTWGQDGDLFFFYKSIFSEGCIVLKRNDLNELYPFVVKNMKIVIRK